MLHKNITLAIESEIVRIKEGYNEKKAWLCFLNGIEMKRKRKANVANGILMGNHDDIECITSNYIHISNEWNELKVSVPTGKWKCNRNR